MINRSLDVIFTAHKNRKVKACEKRKVGKTNVSGKWRHLESLLEDTDLFVENEDTENQFFYHELHSSSKKIKRESKKKEAQEKVMKLE